MLSLDVTKVSADRVKQKFKSFKLEHKVVYNGVSNEPLVKQFLEDNSSASGQAVTDVHAHVFVEQLSDDSCVHSLDDVHEAGEGNLDSLYILVTVRDIEEDWVDQLGNLLHLLCGWGFVVIRGSDVFQRGFVSLGSLVHEKPHQEAVETGLELGSETFVVLSLAEER